MFRAGAILAVVAALVAVAALPGRTQPGFRVGPGDLRAPAGIALLPDGNLIVTQFGGLPALVRIDRRGETHPIDTGPAGLWGVAVTPDGQMVGTDLTGGTVLTRRLDDLDWQVRAAGLHEPSGVALAGETLYVVERGGRLLRGPVQGRSALQTVAKGLGPAEGVAIGPDRIYVSIPLEDRIVAVDTATGKFEDFILDLSLPTGLAMVPGALLAVEGSSGQVWEYRLDDDRRRLVGYAEPGASGLVALPNGDVAVTAITSGTVWRLDPDVQPSEPIAAGGVSVAGSLQVEPVSRLLVTGMTPTEFDLAGKVVHAPLLRSMYLPSERLWGVVDAALAADGSQVYTLTEGGRVLVGWGTSLEVVAEGMDRPTGAFVNENGQIYIAESGAGRIVAIVKGGVRIPITTSMGEPIDLVAAPQGGLLVTDRAGGRLLHVLDSGIQVLRRDLKRPEALALLPDGDLALLEAGTGRVLHLSANGTEKAVLAQLEPQWLETPDDLSWEVLTGLAYDPTAGVLYVSLPARRGVMTIPVGLASQ